MTTGRHSSHARSPTTTSASLAAHAGHLPVGDPATARSRSAPIIDERQRDHIHELVTVLRPGRARGSSRAARTRGCSTARPCSPTCPTTRPAYREEVFGPVAPVIAFDSIDEAVRLAATARTGSSWGSSTGDVMSGLRSPTAIPVGIVHINDQTVNDEVVNPFGGVKETGGARLGGDACQPRAFTDHPVGHDAQHRSPDYPF